MTRRRSPTGVVTTALALLLASALLVGVWASVAPRGFYDSFPGFDLTWISVDGPFNQHLVRDVGSGYLALAILTGAALMVRTPTIVRTTGIVWLGSAVPHVVYHTATIT